MLLSIQLPAPAFESQNCVVRVIHVSEGAVVAPGSKIIDFSVDLSAGQSYDCAPIAHYRLASMEGGLLHRVGIVVGQEIDATAIIGLLSTAGDVASVTPERTARVAVASILHHDDWWDEL